MTIERVIVGVLQANCYIVTKDNKSLIIDPGDDFEKIIDACKGKEVVEILVTHNHFDHVGALSKVENYFNLKKNERSNLFNYEVINTPGHSIDSKCFYFSDELVLFSGDFIFNNAIGRTDLETGSDIDMISSLKMISNYSNNIIIYPGHGSSTTLGKEKQNFNIYL